MKQKKTALIIEDEPKMAKAITKGFSSPSEYDFQVKTASSLSDYVEKGLHEKPFDVTIVDLKLPTGGDRLSGLHVLWLLNSRKATFGDAITVVYSALPQVRNVVRAIQLGASDFVAKAECPPHKLLDKITALLREREEALVRARELDYVLAKNWQEWQAKYAGQVVALVCQDIVASGNSRVEAFLAYEQQLDALNLLPGTLSSPAVLHAS